MNELQERVTRPNPKIPVYESLGQIIKTSFIGSSLHKISKLLQCSGKCKTKTCSHQIQTVNNKLEVATQSHTAVQTQKECATTVTENRLKEKDIFYCSVQKKRKYEKCIYSIIRNKRRHIKQRGEVGVGNGT